MMNIINNLLQKTLKTDVDYYELAEDLYNVIIKNSDKQYNYVIDTIQYLILRKAYIFMTYVECEILYAKIKDSVNACAK